MENQRYYVDAGGNSCYFEGISTVVSKPTRSEIESVIRTHVALPDIKWEHKYGWTIQPEVLTFTAAADEVQALFSTQLSDRRFEYFHIWPVWPTIGLEICGA
jgi:hypothetical protein